MKTKFFHISAFALLTLSVTSCITAKYETPADITDNRLYRDMNVQDTTTIADIPWREYFKDANLQNLIEEGLNNNYDLQIANARIKQAEANLSVAKLGYLPTLNARASVSPSRLNAAQTKGFPTNSTSYELAASASWEADIWGKITSAKKAAMASYLQTDAYKRVVQTALIANIANSYYNLIALDKQLEITQNTIKLLQDNVETMKYLADADIITNAAVEQSKALAYATQVSVPDLEANIKTLENTICLMMGISPSSIARSSIDYQSVPSELKYGVPAQLLSKRPDVMMQEYAYRTSFENTNIAKASLYPSLTLTGSAGYSTVNSLSHFFDASNLFANLVAGLTQPIFNQGKLKNQLKMAQAQQEEALLNFKSAVLNAGSEVSNALYSYQQARSKDKNRTLQIESLQKSVDFTKELLLYSNANYTEVLNAEQNLLSAKLGQVNDKLQQLQAAVNLYRALGGGAE
ncbi:MAG: efflux transporter outer membrane subunit [Flavobacteriaceae bacterium]|jgi:NodT family efflux transporter outer membrane factor (OMF) lipoprotein|nr:efflux transporter outer membrane subunit [Flavobacteriaceae bacterium]